jgi:hypothetical protein
VGDEAFKVHSYACEFVAAEEELQIPPLRFAPVGMTNKERVVVRRGRLLKERAVAKEGVR